MQGPPCPLACPRACWWLGDGGWGCRALGSSSKCVPSCGACGWRGPSSPQEWEEAVGADADGRGWVGFGALNTYRTRHGLLLAICAHAHMQERGAACALKCRHSTGAHVHVCVRACETIMASDPHARSPWVPHPPHVHASPPPPPLTPPPPGARLACCRWSTLCATPQSL